MTINLSTWPMSGEVKIFFFQSDMELPIKWTENVNTQSHNKLLFIKLKFVLLRINIFIQNNLYDLGSLSFWWMVI
jgi:hypothetical protein